MILTKAFGAAVLLTISAFSLAQDKVKIEPKWDKDLKLKMKTNASFEISGIAATIDAVTTWSSAVDKDSYTVTVHHDEFKVVANDMEQPAPVTDYKVTYDQKSSITKFEGGVEGTDALRMFLIGNFYAPSDELTKDTVAKWDIAKNEKTTLGALKIETIFLGDEKVGKNMLHKFKQVVKETGTEYTTTGTFFVNNSGQVLKSNVTFAGLPIPVAGGDAAGKFTATLVE